MATILSTHNLTVGYTQGKRVTALLSDLNLTMQEGRLIALLGQNGAGKSTLLRALTCAAPPLSGTIEIQGRDINEISQRERSRLIGLVSTDRIAVGGLTVTELVALGRQSMRVLARFHSPDQLFPSRRDCPGLGRADDVLRASRRR